MTELWMDGAINWTEAVDIYCERVGPGLWAEPLNAASNIAFFIATWVGWRAAPRPMGWPMAWLLLLTIAVGIGSTLFHTVAQRWAGAADVIPIMLFVLSYLGLAIWRFFGARPAEAIALVLGFLFFAPGLQQAMRAALPPAMAPVFGYAPAFVALAVAGLLLALRRHPAGAWLLAAAGVFSASLSFRAFDMPLCSLWAHGTHIFWHLLNGAVLGTLLVCWARHGAQVAAPRAAR